MNCKHCGKELAVGWEMCPWCGTRVENKPLCANCGKELAPEWVACPWCFTKVGSTVATTDSKLHDDILPDDFALDLVADDIAEAQQRQKDEETAAYKQKLDLARVYCIRKMYAEAKAIYEELIAKNFTDVNAYIGLVRVASQNFSMFDGKEIDEAIDVAKQIARGDIVLLDDDYALYETKRKAHFEEIAKAEAAAKKAKAEAEEAKRKRKAEEEFKKQADIENGVLKKYKGSATTVEIPNSVTSIEDYAFDCCKSLTSITIPNSVTDIGTGPFAYCGSLANICVEEDNKHYKSMDGNLYSKDGTKLIQYAIGKSSTTFTIPNSVTDIGRSAFNGCSSLTSITIPNSVTSIGEYAFQECKNLTSITIPNSVTSIGYYAFAYCKNLTSITIPNSVTSIGKWAFENCSSLKTIYAPSGLYLSECKVPSGCQIIRK